MFMDGPRIRAYEQALRRFVTPDAVVADIGAGTGIFALLACQLGAVKVYAVETDDAIHLAEEMARANGYGDRIVFIQQPSDIVRLPEHVDLVVSDMRGALPLYRQHIPAIIDARERFLNRGGTLIPQRDTLFAALITAPDVYAMYSDPWSSFSIDMQIGRSHAVNTLRKHRPAPEQLLTAPQPFATLDYRSVESPNVSGELKVEVMRSGVAHGFCVWFDAELADDIIYSNAPDAPELVYGQMFFPLAEAAEVRAGDEIAAAFYARLMGDDYTWQWNTRITTRSRHHSFKQSTLLGMPLSLDYLRKLSPNYQPGLNISGKIALMVMQQMNRSTSSGEIAQTILAAFPDRFTDLPGAQAYVSTLIKNYSE